MKRKIFLVIIPLLLFFIPLNAFASSVSTYGVDYCITSNVSTECKSGTNNNFGFNYSNKRINHISFLTFNTNHDINVNAGDIVTLSALVYVKNDSVDNLTEIYDLGPQLYGASTDDFSIISMEPVDMTNTLFYTQNYQLDYYDISYQHLYIIRVQAKKSITREYWRFRWDFDIAYSTTASGSINFRVNVSTGSPDNDYLILQAIQSISTSQNQTNQALSGIQSSLNDDSTTSSQSSSSSFFNNFSVNNHGLTGVVLAPVNFIQSFTNTCQPVTLTLFNKDIPIPCGDTIFWGKSDSRISNFRNIWNVLVGGPIIYALLLSIYRSIHKAMDPDKNEEGGLDL